MFAFERDLGDSSQRSEAISAHAAAVTRSSLLQFADSFPTVPRTRSRMVTGRASTDAIAASICATLRVAWSDASVVDLTQVSLSFLEGARDSFAGADKRGAILRVHSDCAGDSPEKAHQPNRHEHERVSPPALPPQARKHAQARHLPDVRRNIRPAKHSGFR